MTTTPAPITVRYGRKFFDWSPERFGDQVRATDTLIWLRQIPTDIATLIDRADYITDAEGDPIAVDVELNESAVRVIATARRAADQAGWDLSMVPIRHRPGDTTPRTAEGWLAELRDTPIANAARPALVICQIYESNKNLPEYLTAFIPTTRIGEAVGRKSATEALAAFHLAHLFAANLITRAPIYLVEQLGDQPDNLVAACQHLHDTITADR